MHEGFKKSRLTRANTALAAAFALPQWQPKGRSNNAVRRCANTLGADC